MSGDPLIPADKRRMLDEENIAMTMAYNFMSAFVACLVIILLGEWLAKLTKGWIPSVFISAVIILCCFWTFLPKTVVADSKLLPVGSSVAIFLLIAHMGTLFSLKRLLEQWKTVVICLAGLAGMCGLAWVVCPLFMDKALVITGLPPLAGGIVATKRRLMILGSRQQPYLPFPCTVFRVLPATRLRQSASNAKLSAC